jgi:uncharacterized membrane protein
MASRRDWVLGGGLVAMGLVAGLFYAFACGVMPGLAKADDRTLIDAMQQIDVAIENPVFFLTYLGAPVLGIWALVLEWRAGARAAVRWIVAALVLYGIGMLVTGGGNIPLNDDLAQAGDPSRISDPAAVRDDYYGPWVAWNIVRTVLHTAAFCAVLPAWILARRGSALVRP